MKRLLSLAALLCAALLAHAAPGQIGFWQNVASGGAPTITSVTMASSGTSFTSNYSASVSVGAGGAAGFASTPSGGATTVGSITGLPGTSGSHTSSRTILKFETLTFAYTQPGNGVEATSGGADVATVSGISVTNNSTQVTDNFTRANSGNLGANWTHDVAGIGIVSNKASVTNNFGVERWTNTTPSANQFVSLQIDAKSAAGSWQVLARFTATGNGYSVTWDGTTISIYAYTAYSASTLSTPAGSFTTGDWMSIGVSGTTITAYKNGVSLGSATDATYSAAGNGGFSIDCNTGTITSTGFIVSNLP